MSKDKREQVFQTCQELLEEEKSVTATSSNRSLGVVLLATFPPSSKNLRKNLKQKALSPFQKEPKSIPVIKMKKILLIPTP